MARFLAVLASLLIVIVGYVGASALASAAMPFLMHPNVLLSHQTLRFVPMLVALLGGAIAIVLAMKSARAGDTDQ
jgi:hypothetical protein